MYIQPIFLKTNLLTKFAVIWVKRCQKAGFLSPRRFKITVTKEKMKEKVKEKKKERREGKEEKKKVMVALLVFIIATLADNKSIIPSTDVIQLTLTLKMTTAQVVETSVTVNNNSPSYSGLNSPGRSNPTYFWNDSWVQTFHKKKLLDARGPFGDNVIKIPLDIY